MRAPLGDLNPFLTSSASQCFLLWGKEAARLRVDGETCTGERMRAPVSSLKYVIMCMQIFQNLKILPCETSLVLLFCTVCHTSLRKQLFRTTWASGPPLCSNPSMAHDLSLVLFSALLQTLMRGVDVPQLTVISICDVSSLISDLCDQPGRIELIHGSPKITEHLCAKDWTALTDPLIWLRHRLLFPWHPRR
nr:uncharacterized protein LOC106025607 isoform X1 [Cavia porcellus]